MGTCAGHPYAAIAGCVILSSYLVLFIMFYIATYKKAAGRKSGGKGSKNSASVDAAVKSTRAMVNDGPDRKVPVMAQK